MVQKVIMPAVNVVDFASYRNALAVSKRVCRHCGAALWEGEREEECSSTFNIDLPASLRSPRTFCAE